MKILLYFPDYSTNPSVAEDELKVIESVFGQEYRIVKAHLVYDHPGWTVGQYMTDPYEFTGSFDGADLMISKGLGSYYALFFGDKLPHVLINPKLTDNDIPEEWRDEYCKIRPSMRSMDDPRNHNKALTWGVYSTDKIQDNRLAFHYVYPNITVCQYTEITEDFLNDKVVPIIGLLTKSEWYDENGVHFQNHGRIIDHVQRDVFNNCEEYVIPSGVRSIAPEVFAHTNLRKITICDTLEELPEKCFSKCRLLSEVVFDKAPTLRKIAKYCFEGCTSLTSVNLTKSNVSVIEGNAFKGTGLTEIDGDHLYHCDSSALPEGCRISVSRNRLAELLDAFKLKSDLRNRNDNSIIEAILEGHYD